MRIGIDARFLGSSSSYGLAQYSENLLVALSRHDAENEYIVFVGTGLKKRLKVGENFRLVPIAGRPLSVRGILGLWLALRREKCDLLHVHFPLAPIGIDCPTLITVHDVVPFRRAGASRLGITFWDRMGSLFLYPSTMRRASWILCVSQATRTRLSEIFPDAFHKSIVRPSGVEELYRRPLEGGAADLIRSRLDAAEKFILYSGSLGADKNVPRMLQAFAILRQNDPRAQNYQFLLDISGDPRAVKEVKSVIARFGLESRARVLSGLSSDERRVLFEAASLLFIMSKEEGFGFPVLKAQSLGVPVLGADSGALPEICGRGAILVDPDDIEGIASELSRILFDTTLREGLIERGKTNSTRFSWDDTAIQVRQIYELLF